MLLTIQNSRLKIDLLPKIGGKIVSIISKKTDRNYLLSKCLPKYSKSTQYITPTYGNAFNLRYAYGFDECFPTIKPCTYNYAGGTISLPDHGELWSRPWEYNYKDNTLTLSIKGEKLDYVFKKEIRLLHNRLIINYSLENISNTSFSYIWSPHPLLSVCEGDKILLNEEVKKMRVYWSSDIELINRNKWIHWPTDSYNDKNMDWSFIQGKGLNFAAKLFSDRLETGQAIYNKKVKESFLIEFNTKKTPFLGLWLCYGGWPDNESTNSYTIALEPTNSRSDSLVEASTQDEDTTINPKDTHKWCLKFHFIPSRAMI